MTHKIAEARLLYGDDVYNLTLKQLRQEFGEDAFPQWLSRFSNHNNIHALQQIRFWRPLDNIPDTHEQVQLWTITESFCYPGNPMAFEHHLQPDEMAYFKVFTDSLRYNTTITFQSLVEAMNYNVMSEMTWKELTEVADSF